MGLRIPEKNCIERGPSSAGYHQRGIFGGDIPNRVGSITQTEVEVKGRLCIGEKWEFRNN